MNELLLNMDLYSESSVNAAIEAYKSIAKVKYTKDKKYIICEFSDLAYPIEKVKAEFENYLVSIVYKESHV